LVESGSNYDLVILGSGPGGYVAGIRAGQLGIRTAVIERAEIGGICLNWGCIPSKALLRNAEVLSLFNEAERYGIEVSDISADFGKAIDRSREVVDRLTKGVAYLLKKNKVDVISGTGALIDPGTVRVEGESPQTLTAKNIMIATGARQRGLPNLPIDGKIVITSRQALEMREAPERVVIVGGGATGAEFGYLYNSYGSEVTIVELMPRMVPLEDEDVGNQLSRSFKKMGVKVMTDSQVLGITTESGVAKVSVSKGGNESVIECDRVLVAVGVTGNIEDIGLEAAGVQSERGFIPVDDAMQTNVPGVYAIGDVTGKLLLAHVASAQGVTAVETMAGLEPPALDYDLMPKAVYSRPQVASFGMTEQAAREAGRELKIGKFPLSASGKALALGETDGFIKVVADAEIGEILGVHMVGAEVTELLGEASLAKLLEGTTTEIGWLVHPHPTISEALKEAALAAEGEAIHV
jgi:dihydrolipoamide dehydrogenase